MTAVRRPTLVALLLVGVLAVLAGAGASAARASSTQESWFQDDNQLIYANSTTEVARTLDALKTLGVERVRVSVFWRLVAPNPTSTTRPAFAADDPSAYPAANWTRYDNLVELAAARGISVDFDVTSPVPSWALTPTRDPDTHHNWLPSPREFGLFTEALGRRYSGTFTPPITAPAAPVTPPQQTTGGSGSGGVLGGLGNGSSSPGASAADVAPAGSGPLPRVSFWSVWNEPNQPGWLLPQWSRDRRAGLVERAPVTYRALLDNAYQGLAASGHGQDPLTIGETAPKGSPGRGTAAALTPLRFVRRLYCLGDRLRVLTGALAQAEGCPTGRNAAAVFARAHPALFAAAGFADHPYTLLTAPHIVSSDPDYVALAELGRLTRLLDRAASLYHRRRGMPLYLTEYGYQTNPPDPYSGLPLATQASYLNEADYLAALNPRVRALSQFLLRDDKPLAGVPATSVAYWSTFQSGLQFADGSDKPSLAAYRLPVYVPRPVVKRGRPVVVWGQLRLAPRGTRQVAQLQFNPTGQNRWQAVATRATSNPKGFLNFSVRLAGEGLVRIAWAAADGTIFTSRATPVFVVR